MDVSHVEDGTVLFPGQVVAIRGIHTMPKLIKVTKILEGVTPAVEYVEAQDKTRETGLSIISATGPFCVEGSTAFDLLDDLAAVVKEKKPNLVILVRVFVKQAILNKLDVFFNQNF